MSHTARVGLFMLVALAILGVFIFKIEEIPLGAHGGRERVEAVFPSVAGLDEKSPVRIAGVRVGIVESIRLQGSNALVTLALDRGVKLHEGARAEVTSLGMLGDKYVELIPGDPSAPPLPRGTVLHGTSPIGFDEALKSFNNAFANIDAVTASLRKTMAGPEGEKRLQEILDNVRALTASIRDLVASNRANVDATVSNIRSFSESLKTELPRFADRLVALADDIDSLVKENRGNVNASLGNIKDLTAELRVSAENLNRITGKIASGQGSVGKLVNEDTTVDNLNSTLKSVQGGADALKNTIGRAERWRLDVNLRAESLPELPKGSTSRSAIGFDLHTTPRRFLRLEFVDSPFPRVYDTTRTTTTIFPDGHSETTTVDESRTSENTTYNAQVGYSFPYFTLRAGLFESKGGVGVDKFLARNRLVLTLEAYDFSRQPNAPHVRLEGRYFLTRNVFAYAGWDDPTYAARRSVLFGAGVTWGDEDLKYLLGSLGSAVPK
jgi:phospholipid/cholesterol/gamma-HCH transport system substrate-binding protein